MIEKTIRIKKITLLCMNNTTDKIVLLLDAPTAFPEMKYETTLEMSARKGYGKEFIQEYFGCEPDEVLVVNNSLR